MTAVPLTYVSIIMPWWVEWQNGYLNIISWLTTGFVWWLRKKVKYLHDYWISNLAIHYNILFHWTQDICGSYKTKLYNSSFSQWLRNGCLTNWTKFFDAFWAIIFPKTVDGWIVIINWSKFHNLCNLIYASCKQTFWNPSLWNWIALTIQSQDFHNLHKRTVLQYSRFCQTFVGPAYIRSCMFKCYSTKLNKIWKFVSLSSAAPPRIYTLFALCCVFLIYFTTI